MSAPQQQYPQQQYPQQPGQAPMPPQAPMQGGQSVIDLRMKYPFGAFIFAAISPKVQINGMPVAGRWGEQSIPVTPGRFAPCGPCSARSCCSS